MSADVLVGVAACVAVPIAYKAFRSYYNPRVNCWFCNTYTIVNRKDRNSFECPHCGQYNGFSADGGYNKSVPGQRYPYQRYSPQFCVPNDEGVKKQNSFCPKCIRNQTVILEKIREFEPINENKWDEELQMFRYKLDKIYPLCAQCTMMTQTKIQQDKLNYSYLLTLKENIAPSIYSAMTSVSRIPKRIASKCHRRFFFDSGRLSVFMNFITLAAMFAATMANVNYLQEDADNELISFPYVVKACLHSVYDLNWNISMVAFVAHFVSLCSSRSRVSFPDLLFPLFSGALVLLGTFSEKFARDDLALYQCSISSLSFLLSSAVTLAPRKRKHKRRPNNVLASAFSVASTPASQCSSQASSTQTTPFFGRTEVTNAASFATPRNPLKSRWRERAPSPEVDATRDSIDMDWETSTAGGGRDDDDYSSIASRPTITREATPSRELAPSLSSMSLGRSPFTSNTPRQQAPSCVGSYRSVASSQHTLGNHPTTLRRAASMANSQLSGALMRTRVFDEVASTPMFTNLHTGAKSRAAPSVRSLSVRDAYRDASDNESVFTSISQQESHAYSMKWIFAAVGLSVFSVLVNVVLVYMLFSKKSD